MTWQNSQSVTESMEEIMHGWDMGKKYRVQDKTYGEYHNHSLLGQRDIMLPKQMDLPLNVLELLYGVHALPLSLLSVFCQVKKIPIPHTAESG